MNVPFLKPAAPAGPVSVVERLNDFPDRLSPILVKELRQGLRQPTFVIAFLCLQVLLCIVVLISVISAPVGSQAGLRVGQTVSGFFFVLLAIVIMLVQPLRGLGALANEIKADTLDLLLLTRLNSWRITFGKWLALVSQSALLVVAVIPYLILRYYLGGMQLFSELLSLATLFIASASLTGITVGFSATPSLVIRGLVALGMLIAMLTLPNILMFSLMYGRRGGGGSPFDLTLSSSAEVSAFAGILLLMAFFGYYFLEMGATQIAPPAENRSTCKRLVGLAVLGLLAWLLPNDGIMLYVCWLLAASLLIVDALSERPGFTASVLQPFRRFGPLRRAVGLVLLPGWPSGLMFVALLAVITMALSMNSTLSNNSYFNEMQAFWPLCVASLLLPAVVTAWFIRKAKNLFATYIVVLLASAILSLALFIISETTNTTKDMILLVPLCPSLGIMSYGEYSKFQRTDSLMMISTVTCCAYWVALFVRSLPHWVRIRTMDQNLTPKPAPAVAVADPADVA